MVDTSRYCLLLLRAYYALIGFGTMAVFWPALLSHSDAWSADNGVQYSLLGALSPLALVGLRYPLKMLPIVIYEFVWKSLWFIFVMAPLWRHGAITDQVWSNVVACGIAIALTPVVVPWRYVWRTYVAAPPEAAAATSRA